MKIIINRKLSIFFCSTLIQAGARLILGSVFIYASFNKIIYPLEFSEIVYNYRIIPDILINFSAVVLPWVELISGLFLILGVFVRSSAIILSSMLSIFIIAILINIVRGINLSCGCFSVGFKEPKVSGFLLVIRDLLILMPGIIIILFYKDRKNLETR
jgi:uncharacterized membrane protein YphA (DoxX/SURF4 family)